MMPICWRRAISRQTRASVPVTVLDSIGLNVCAKATATDNDATGIADEFAWRHYVWALGSISDECRGDQDHAVLWLRQPRQLAQGGAGDVDDFAQWAEYRYDIFASDREAWKDA